MPDSEHTDSEQQLALAIAARVNQRSLPTNPVAAQCLAEALVLAMLIHAADTLPLEVLGVFPN